MNRRYVSVFFSALLCSTFGHEHLRAHDLQRRHHEYLGSYHGRANQQQCSYTCPVPSPSPEAIGAPVSLVFIEETKVFALVNITLDLAIVLQIGEPIALLANGKTGVSIVINIDKQTVVHYPAGCNGNQWKASESNLLEYLQKLGPLTNVNNWKNGQSFKPTKVTKEVRDVLISIVQHLDIEVAVRVKINPDAVVSLVSVLVNGLSKSSNVVKLLLMRLESSVTVIYGGLTKLVNLIVGLKSIEKHLQGGIQSIIKNDTNIALVLGENSGFNSLIDILLQACDHVDLTKVLGNLIQSPEGFAGLVAELDGGIYLGISGITAVIHNIQLYAAKKISLEALIDVIIQVQSWNSHFKITEETCTEALNWYFILAESQATQFNTSSSWSVLNKFFTDIKNDQLFINGINVSGIINVLVSTSGTASLSNVVKILLYLEPDVSLSRIIAILYFRLITFVISGHGLVFIKALLPQISITINCSSKTSILKQILSRVDVVRTVSSLLRLDITGAISNLPVLGPISKALDEGIKNLGVNTGVTVASSLKTSGSIFSDLKNLILYGLGKGGKAPADSGIAGLSILGGGISVNKTTWTSSEAWSTSNGGSAGSGSHSGGHKGSGGFGWTLFGG